MFTEGKKMKSQLRFFPVIIQKQREELIDTFNISDPNKTVISFTMETKK